MELKKFSDFAIDEKRLDGAKVRIDDIINKEIVIKAYTLSNTKYNKNKSGKYATVQFNYINNSDINHIFFTGSDIIIEQLDKYQVNIPFYAIIRKINRYYTLS